jgi:glycerol uptake facilitator-like aquaporin
LNDTGLVGLVLFGAFTVAVIVRVWRRRHDEVVLGLSQMALVLVIANLATQTTQLMVDWLLIGLLVAAVDIASAVPKTGSERRPARQVTRGTSL